MPKGRNAWKSFIRIRPTNACMENRLSNKYNDDDTFIEQSIFVNYCFTGFL